MTPGSGSLSTKIGIIWLHGLGDTEHGWQETLQSEWTDIFAESHIDVQWRFPRASEQKVTANQGMRMTSWFDLEQIPVTVEKADTKEEDIASSVSFVHAEIDKLTAGSDKIPPENVFVGGFSQGGAITLRAGLTYSNEKRLGGIICFSGWVLNEKSFREEAKLNQQTPVLWWHGSVDNVVQFSLQEKGVAFLKSVIPADQILAKQSRMAHSSHPDQMVFVPKWIKEQVKKASTDHSTQKNASEL
ncbi:unnamed protein product [Amoebophrya sp. A120]|nr:unnamed protein product [Amoebophrya sp. A120]|eukprot:GSA120T00024709001.1